MGNATYIVLPIFFYLGLSMFRINNDKTITTSAKTLKELYNKWQKDRKGIYLGRGRHNAITFEEHKNVNRGLRVLFYRKDIHLSIVFGCGQYCQHYDNILECRNLFPQTLPWESMDCEVGTLSINRDSSVWYNLPQKYGMHQNEVYAYQTPEQVDSLNYEFFGAQQWAQWTVWAFWEYYSGNVWPDKRTALVEEGYKFLRENNAL